MKYKPAQARQPKEKQARNTLQKSNALGDDRNLADYGGNRKYWYSIGDGFRLLIATRHKLDYIDATSGNFFSIKATGEDHSATRENNEHIFIADPYYIGNFADSLSDDIKTITGTHIVDAHGDDQTAKNNQWSAMPTLLVIPLLSGMHWQAIRVQIDYVAETASILYSDPYGENGFSNALVASIRESLLPAINDLIRAHGGAAIPEGSITSYKKIIDQQGRGVNGFDCGPITFSNIVDYMYVGATNEQFADGTRPHTVSAAAGIGHEDIMVDLRARDVETYNIISGVALPGSSAERMENIKKLLKESAEAKRVQLQSAAYKDTAYKEIASKISSLPDGVCSFIFEIIDSERAQKKLDLKEGYSIKELDKAYNLVTGEGLIIQSVISDLRTNRLFELKSDFNQYEVCLQQANTLLEASSYEEAEYKYAAALKIVQNKKYALKQVDCLSGIGNTYLLRGDYIKAVALYNAAKVRCKSEDRTQYALLSKSAEKLFLESVAAKILDVSLPQLDIEHKDCLEKLRQWCKNEINKLNAWWAIAKQKYQDEESLISAHQLWLERAQRVKELYEYINKEYKAFISDLIKECKNILGPAPCQYAVIGLGSLSGGIATPYSDFEWGILIEENKDSNLNKQYFKSLTNLLYIKMLNLGETILPSMAIKSINNFYSEDQLEDNWFFDDIAPRGLAFDGLMPGACKWPLGNMHTDEPHKYELIQTPLSMANFQNKYKKDHKLLQVLANVCFLEGNLQLVENYYVALNKMAKTGQQLKDISTTLLREDSEKYKLGIFNIDHSGELFNVKKDIYRLPDRIIIALGQYFLSENNISSLNVWSLIDNLPLITQAKQNLLIILSIAVEIRLNTYLRNGAQQEDLLILHPIPGLTSTQLEPCIAETATLKRFFYTAVSLAELIPHYLDGNFDIFTADLYADNYFISAAIEYRFSNRQKSCSELIKFLKKDTISKEEKYIASLHLGTVLCQVGEYKQSLTYLLPLIKDTDQYNLANLYLTIAHDWEGMSKYEIALSNYNKALENLANAMFNTPFAIYLSIAQFYYRRSKLKEAKEYCDKCGLYLKTHKVSQSYTVQYYSLLSLFESNHNQVPDYYQQISKVNNKRFADQPSIEKLIISANAAQYYFSLGKSVEFKEHMRIALYIADQIKDNISPEYINALRINYASCLEKIGELNEALDEYYKIKPRNEEENIILLMNQAVVLTKAMQFSQALEMLQKAEKLYSDKSSAFKNPEIIANIYHNLIELYLITNKFDEVKASYNKAYETFKEIHGSDNNKDCAMLYNQFGRLNKNLGEHEQAINFHNKALDTFQTLGQNLEVAKTYVFLSSNYMQLQNWGAAKDAAIKAIELYDSFKKDGVVLDPINYALALTNLGTIHSFDDKNYEQALNYLNQAEELYNKIIKVKNYDFSVLKYYKGECYYKMQNYKTAHNEFHQALVIVRELIHEEQDHKLFLDNIENGLMACKKMLVISQTNDPNLLLNFIPQEAMEHIMQIFLNRNIAIKTESRTSTSKDQKREKEITASSSTAKTITHDLQDLSLFLKLANIDANSNDEETGDTASHDEKEVKHAGDYINIKARKVPIEYWLDYAEVGFKHLLELRLENVGITNNIKILNSVTIGDLKSQSLLDSITASLHIIANDRDIENILIPISIFQGKGIYHRVALAIKIQADHSLEINYLDSENQPIKEDIIQGFISQLQELNYKISYQQLPVEQQKYNNCSPEVIENIVAYLTGSRVTQELAVPLHSLLYQVQLTNEPLGIKQAIEEIKVAYLASSINNMFATVSDEQTWSNLQHVSKPEFVFELPVTATYDTANTISLKLSTVSVMINTVAQIDLPMITVNTEQTQGCSFEEVIEALITYTSGIWRDSVNSQQESILSPGLDLRQLLKDGLNWGNRQLDTYFKQMFGVSEYEELQALADKYNIGIKVTDKNSAQKSYRKIALQTHTDKAQDSIEEKQRDFIRAKALSEVDSSVTDKEIYSPIMAGLDKIHSGIRLAGSLVDTIKLLNDPSQNNIIKTAIGYGYLAETIIGHSVGMKYLASLNIGYQLYQGEYGEAASSVAKMAGYMLPGMLMAPAPALAVTIKAGFIAYDTYYTAAELYGEIGNLWDQEIP